VAPGSLALRMAVTLTGAVAGPGTSVGLEWPGLGRRVANIRLGVGISLLRLWLWLPLRLRISRCRNRSHRSSGRRDCASYDRPERGGLRKLLRDAREDVLALSAGRGRNWLFLQGTRPRAWNC
jgi:hypothetical protein